MDLIIGRELFEELVQAIADGIVADKPSEEIAKDVLRAAAKAGWLFRGKRETVIDVHVVDTSEEAEELRRKLYS